MTTSVSAENQGFPRKVYDVANMPKGTKLCQILTGNSVKRKCSEVTEGNLADLEATIWRMIRACMSDDGAGLAAPQIGVYKRIFIIACGKGLFHVYINPNFTPVAGAVKVAGVEGCLSVPGKRISVKRYNAILSSWSELSDEGKLIYHESFEADWPARVFQHEKDHLDGVTILDKR